jgi:hypothetical protein
VGLAVFLREVLAWLWWKAPLAFPPYVNQKNTIVGWKSVAPSGIFDGARSLSFRHYNVGLAVFLKEVLVWLWWKALRFSTLHFCIASKRLIYRVYVLASTVNSHI